MKYAIELWDGQKWELTSTTSELSYHDEIPLTIISLKFGFCHFHRTEIMYLPMYANQAIVLIYRGLKQDESFKGVKE